MSILIGPKPNLSKMDTTQLKTIAKAFGAEVPAKATKDQLIKLIEAKRG